MQVPKFVQQIDGAQLVKTYSVGEELIVQVWHGGTTVNVYSTLDWAETISEVDVWSSSDEEGYALELEEIARRMDVHFEMMKKEREACF